MEPKSTAINIAFKFHLCYVCLLAVETTAFLDNKKK